MAARTPSTQFRILALPLVRLPRSTTSLRPPPSPSSSTSTSTLPNPLILFHISQPPPPTPSPIDVNSPDVKTVVQPTKTPIYQKALNKASEQWLKLGDKPKNGWMYWFYAKGEGLMDKIEYEEWALKSVQEGLGVRVAKDGEVQEKIEIPLLYPQLKDQPLPALIPKLHRLLAHRIPYHKKMMTRSLIFTPFTFPFAIIPVLPNFPMFYVLWRAYSHYKAYRGAVYLEQLLKLGMIVETPSKELDSIYAKVADSASGPVSGGGGSTGVKGLIRGKGDEVNHAPDETTSKGVDLNTSSTKSHIGEIKGSETDLPSQAKGESKTAPDGTSTPSSMVYQPKPITTTTVESSSPGSTTAYPGLLLTLKQVPELADIFGFRQTEVIDVNRAVEQAEKRAKEAVDKSNVEAERK